MVASLQASRIGSGGVSIPVILQDPETRQVFAKLRADVAQAAKDLKVKPQIDYEETQFVRSLQSSLRKIERENARIRVAVELDQKGLADAALKAGAITQAQMAAIRSGQAAVPLRGAFTGMEAEIRGAMAAEIRSMRNAARQATISDEVRRRLYGDPAPEVERFRSSDAAGALMSGRLGSGSEGYAARVASANAVPMVNDTPASARASLAAANKLYQERMDLEKKFLDQIKSEGGGAGDEDDAGRLRRVWRAGRRAPSRSAEYGGVWGLLGSLAGVTGAVNTLGVGAAVAQGGFMAHAGGMAGLQGQLNAAEAMKSLPVVGSIAKLFDEASGFTRSLRVRMEAGLDLRAAGVDAARLTRSRTVSAEAEGVESLAQLRDKYGKEGVLINDADDGSGNATASAFGSATGEAAQRALEAYNATKANVRARVARTRAELRAEQDVSRADIQATNLETARNPREAARVRMLAENRAAASLAEPELQDLTRRQGDARYQRLVADQNHSLWMDTFGSQSRTGAAQIRVQNRGLSLDDENAFTTLRGFDAAIADAPEAGGYKSREKFEALSGARALLASLQPHGGGNADVVSLATQSAASDPFNIRPESAARLRAQQMTAAYIGKVGGADALNLNTRLGPGEAVSSPTQQIIQLLSSMVELLGRAAIIPLQNN